jgi:hypothetical protein
MESTECLVPATIMLCCICAICFCAAASSENDQGSMNFDSNTAPVLSTTPSKVAAIHTMDEWNLRV